MLLTINAGNTNIKFAVFEDAVQKADWCISTVVSRTGDEYAALLRVLLAERELRFCDIDGVAISTVVPGVLDALIRLSKYHLSVEKPFVLSAEMDLGIIVHYHPKHDVGADRVANAIGAHAKYGGKVIVVDLGTGTTLDAVAENGDYLGGAIAPGIQISLDALISRASKLTGVQLTAPDKAIGSTTSESLQSGTIFGFAGMVDALVDRFQTEMGGGAKVIATGGLAEIIAEHSHTIECCDEYITLEGLRILYERGNRE